MLWVQFTAIATSYFSISVFTPSDRRTGAVLATNLIRQFILWYQIESLQILDLFCPKACQQTIHIGKMSWSQAAASSKKQKPDELNGPSVLIWKLTRSF